MRKSSVTAGRAAASGESTRRQKSLNKYKYENMRKSSVTAGRAACGRLSRWI